jgi:hypothetical protein
MWQFTEIAKWFEDKRAQSDAVLDQWVEESNYSTGVMVVAATTKAFTTVGAGFVDVLRLGDGVSQGTWKGAGEDALRLVAIFPVGKAAQLLRSVRGTALARVIVDTGGPNCFWVASAKAFGQIGHKVGGKLLASVDDVARALKMPMSNLWAIPNLATGMAYLQRIGAKIGAVKPVAGAADIVQMVPRDGSVVMIAVKVMDKANVVGGHAIYAFRNTLGQVRYMDRTVGNVAAGAQGVFKSIDEIAPLYGATALVPYEAAILHNVIVKTFAYDLPRLVLPVLGVVATENRPQ